MLEYCASGNPTKCRVLHTARLQVVDAVGLGRGLDNMRNRSKLEYLNLDLT